RALAALISVSNCVACRYLSCQVTGTPSRVQRTIGLHCSPALGVSTPFPQTLRRNSHGGYPRSATSLALGVRTPFQRARSAIVIALGLGATPVPPSFPNEDLSRYPSRREPDT